jgi:hypothetical protein
MAIPKNVTPKLVRELNAACKAISEALPEECADCMKVGWCGAVWVTVMAGYRNAKMVGKLDGEVKSDEAGTAQHL